jgi:hypothetical protein
MLAPEIRDHARPAVVAHMGHSWEALLIRFMRKYLRLYLADSAWLAKYMDPEIIRSRWRRSELAPAGSPASPSAFSGHQSRET